MIETVNGYVCRDCSDVALAKRHIDPAHPTDTVSGADRMSVRGEAVTFGGTLAHAEGSRRVDPTAAQAQETLPRAASLLDLRA